MKLIHTSPEKIKKIDNNIARLFGDCLFFSSSRYTMTQADAVYTYSIEIDEEKVISVGELYSEEIIADIMLALDVDEHAAERMLDERDPAHDHTGNSEDNWYIQWKQGECAKLMGYEACEATDEQGAVWIVPMTGRVNDLKLESVS